MVLGCRSGDCRRHQLITFRLERPLRRRHTPHGEYTRERANDAERNAWNAGDAASAFRSRWVCDGVPMTAISQSSVVESVSSPIDPDARARSANDGEPSAGSQTDLTIHGDAADGLLAAEDF